LPSLDWLREATPEYTPDMARLSRYKRQLLFVPDEMMLNHKASPLLGKFAELRAVALTAEENFVLWRKDSGIESEAVPMQGGWQEQYLRNMRMNGEPMFPYARIRGELYSVTPSRFITLDNYKRNGVEFERRRVDLVIPYRLKLNKNTSSEQYLQPVKAWMYLGVPDFWSDFIKSPMFHPVDVIKPNNPKLGLLPMRNYYYFHRLLYNNDPIHTPYIHQHIPSVKDNKSA